MIRGALPGAALLLMAGCGSGGDGFADAVANTPAKPAYGDVFVEPLLGNISGLIPQLTTDVYSSQVASQIYNGLIGMDGHARFVPELAESWKYSDDCRDITFKLRKGVKWHDGQPFSAADVLFTHAMLVHPKTPTARRDDYAAVEKIDAPDPHTIRVRYKTAYARGLM